MKRYSPLIKTNNKLKPFKNENVIPTYSGM